MYDYITGSVGKNAQNAHSDVMSIQIRLNRWIMEGKLKHVPMLAVDGGCGNATKQAIGAFQFALMGHKNPDCRVDPGGKTLEALFQSLVRPLTASDKELLAYLNKGSGGGSGGNGAQQKPAVDVSDWIFDPNEIWKIGKEHGNDVAQWILIPPVNGPEGKEFRVPSWHADKFCTMFAWKSATPGLDCAANIKPRFQMVMMLRDDMPFWQDRSKDNTAARIFQYCAACAVRDYRDFIVNRAMCPRAAFNRLVAIGKDVVFEMFLGMFQLMNPVGVPGAGNYKNVSEALANLVQKIDEYKVSGKLPWDPYTPRAGSNASGPTY